MTSQGSIVGEVEGITFDSSWEVNGLVVKVSCDVAKEFGIKKTFGSTKVVVGLTNVKAITDNVMLDLSKNELAETYVKREEEGERLGRREEA